MFALAGVVDAEWSNLRPGQEAFVVIGRFGGQRERSGGVAEEQQEDCGGVDEWFGGEHGFCGACFAVQLPGGLGCLETYVRMSSSTIGKKSY